MAKICPSCGYEARDTEKFCQACGSKLDVSAAPAEPAAPAAPAEPAQSAAPVPPPVGYGGQGQPASDYNAPQGNNPQYGAPQGGNPQYGASQYGAPQGGNPQYGASQYGAPQGGNPQYGASQYGAPQGGVPQNNIPGYGAPNYGGIQTGAQPQPKKKTGLIIGIIVGAVLLIAIIVGVAIGMNRGGSGSGGTGIVGSTSHELDGDYKLTGMFYNNQDYSSLLGYLEDDYHLTINGSDCSLEMGDNSYDLKIDQENRRLYSDSSVGSVDLTVNGDEITIEVEGTKMVFTKK